MFPYLFKIGGFALRIYSIMLIIAILVAIFFCSRRSRSMNLSKASFENMMIATFVGGIIGARLYYVVFNWSYFSSYPKEIMAIWHGGLAIHGGIIAGLITAFIYSYIKKISIIKFADIAAPFLLLGQGIGRFGNFANGEAHGVPTITPPEIIFSMKTQFPEFWSSVLSQEGIRNVSSSLTAFYEKIAGTAQTILFEGKEYILKEYVPWGVKFPSTYNSLAYQEFGSIPLHPTFFYEMILNFIGAAILLLLWRKDKNIGTGKIFSLYLLFYGIIRAFVTFFRVDDLMLGPFRAPHLASLLMVAGAAVWYAVSTWYTKKQYEFKS